MKTTIQHNNTTIQVDLSKPIDISIPLSNTDANPIAWYINKPVIEPVKFDEWVGKVSSGMSSTNFNNIQFNPHGHGTHTECLGHITHDVYSVNQALKQFFFVAELISVELDDQEGDFVITKAAIETALMGKKPEAIVIRTLPNDTSKLSRKYSHTDPPFLAEAAALFLRESGIQHLLIDLPSVDNLNADARLDCTITEMIFVSDEVKDGSYLLNLQIASFENDASPSKPVLYSILDDKQ